MDISLSISIIFLPIPKPLQQQKEHTEPVTAIICGMSYLRMTEAIS